MEMLRRGGVAIAFHLEDHAEPLDRLIRKYANVPMSLADACLVVWRSCRPRAWF